MIDKIKQALRRLKPKKLVLPPLMTVEPVEIDYPHTLKMRVLVQYPNGPLIEVPAKCMEWKDK